MRISEIAEELGFADENGRFVPPIRYIPIWISISKYRIDIVRDFASSKSEVQTGHGNVADAEFGVDFP